MPLRTVVSISLIYMTRMLGLFMVLPVLFLLGQDYPGATATTLGIALGIYGLTQASLQIPLGLLSDILGRRPVLLAGLLIFLGGSLVAALADDVVWLIIGRALQGAGAISSTLLALLADLTPPKYRTRALAVVGISIGASFTLAMVVGPLVAQWWGLSGVFLMTAALALASVALVLTLPVPIRNAQDGYQRWQASAVLPVLMDRRLWSLNAGVFFLHAILAAAFLFLPQQLLNANKPAIRSRQTSNDVYEDILLLFPLPCPVSGSRGMQLRQPGYRPTCRNYRYPGTGAAVGGERYR